MGYKYLIDISQIDKLKNKYQNNYIKLVEDKKSLQDSLDKKISEIYNNIIDNLENKLKEKYELYEKNILDILNKVNEDYKSKIIKKQNRIFKIGNDVSFNTENIADKLMSLTNYEKEKLNEFNENIKSLESLKEEILLDNNLLKKIKENKDKLQVIKKYGDSYLSKINSIKIRINDIDKEISNFWNKNKILDEKTLKRLDEVKKSNPLNKNINSTNNIVHLSMKKYEDKKYGINIDIPVYIDDDLSVIFNVKNENSIDTLKVVITSYLLRVIYALKPQYVNVNIVDVKENGIFFSKISTLNNLFPDIINENIIYNKNDVSKLIEDLNKLLLKRIRLFNEKDISIYNKTATSKEKNQIYVINDFENIFKEDIKLFENILKYGKKYGIYLILVGNIDTDMTEYSNLIKSIHKNDMDKTKFNILNQKSDDEIKKVKEIIKLSCNLERIIVGNDESVIYKEKSYLFDAKTNTMKLEHEKIAKEYFNEKALEILTSNLVKFIEQEKIRNEEKNKLSLDELISKLPRHLSSLDGIKIPIGINSKNEFEYIEFSDDYIDAILTGASGAGKSRLYNYLLLNSMYMYDSNELEIYILDLKEGVEFSVYSDYNLPSIKAIYGNMANPVEILAHLVYKLKQRTSLFIKEKVPDIKQYRLKTGKKLPKILLIVDEFQMILSDSNSTSTKAKEYITQLITQGRAEGIHIIMCAQNITSESGITDGINKQLNTKILIRSIETSIDSLLGSSFDKLSNYNERNKLVKEIMNFPKGMGIINNKSGDIKYNKIFRFPNSTPEQIKNHLKILEKEYIDKNIISKPLFKNSSQNNILEVENMYFKNKYNLSTYPIAILGKYMRLENAQINIEYDKNKNSNILVTSSSVIKCNYILKSYLKSLEIWDRYNKNNLKVYILDFENISNNVKEEYINNKDFVCYHQYRGDIDNLKSMLEKIKNDNFKYKFLVINKINRFKEYYNNQYSPDVKVKEIVNTLINFQEMGYYNNINLLVISSLGVTSLDSVINDNSKYIFFDNTNEYDKRYFNRKDNILFKDIDISSNVSEEINLFVD